MQAVGCRIYLKHLTELTVRRYNSPVYLTSSVMERHALMETRVSLNGLPRHVEDVHTGGLWVAWRGCNVVRRGSIKGHGGKGSEDG